MEVENAINAMTESGKEKSNYKKGDKMMIVAEHTEFNYPISAVVQSDIKAQNFMEHISNILSSNEEMYITQATFSIKIINIPHGSKGETTINLRDDTRTKQWLPQINTPTICAVLMP